MSITNASVAKYSSKVDHVTESSSDVNLLNTDEV